MISSLDSSSHGVYSHSQPNFFQKSMFHALGVRLFTTVGIDTEKSYFSVSPRFLSVSVSPRMVAGKSCIPWDMGRLQVC